MCRPHAGPLNRGEFYLIMKSEDEWASHSSESAISVTLMFSCEINDFALGWGFCLISVFVSLRIKGALLKKGTPNPTCSIHSIYSIGGIPHK